MWRGVIIVFLIAHGLLHPAIWGMPRPANPAAPYPAHSWLLGDQPTLALSIAMIAMLLLVAGGLALWARATWWRLAAVAGLSTSFVLMLAFFNPWFMFIEAVNLALIVGVGWLDWFSPRWQA
jgi:hypothetical protein